VSTFITPMSIGAGTKVAIKDLIDIAGQITTAGCQAVADVAVPAEADAPCLTEIVRLAAAGKVHIVGKTNLHELAFGTTGRNPWFGTPVNPLDPTLVPGGSSSGSAVAVCAGDADVALGSDTGGSVRIPSACCGGAGLKTTWGRIPLDGVYPLSPSLDTIGPMARTVAGLITGMELLEPGFTIATPSDDLRIGRLRVEAEPGISEAIDRALARSGIPVSDVADPGWADAWQAAAVIVSVEAWRVNQHLMATARDRIGDGVASMVEFGGTIAPELEQQCRDAQGAWSQRLRRLVSDTTVLALPTLQTLPPSLDDDSFDGSTLNMPVNLAGLPALAIPVPTSGRLPASLQLIGPPGGEELLLAVGQLIEAAQ
jgi:amidase